jgi:phosphatidylglycerol:prolipoprotein diacylglycerol transferase
MHPFLFEIFGFKLYSYGVAMVIAFIICITITLKTTPKNLLSSQDIYNFCLIIMASLLFGTRLMGLIVYGNFDGHAFLDLLTFWKRGNFSFFPAFLLAIILIFVYCKVKKISLLKTMDYLLPIAILGVGIQRTFGCFLAGCCYGKPTNLPWGMVFSDISRAGRHFPGIPLHPTQLYYGLTAFMIFAFLVFYKKRTQKTGEITGLGFLMLASSYFFITFLRGDITADQIFYHISRSQYLALGLFAAGSFIYLRVSKKLFEICKEKIATIGGIVKHTFSIILLTVVLLVGLISCSTGSEKKDKINRGIVPSGSDLGSLSNPVKCDMEEGEREYLKRLTDHSGGSVHFRRIGHAHPDGKGNILDKYEIKTVDGSLSVEIYMDMHCPGYVEKEAIKGFKIKPPDLVKYKFETNPLTPGHVYQMIIENGFYCEIPMGNHYHDEALTTVNKPANSVFPLKRKFLIDKKNNGIIETWSETEFDSFDKANKKIRLNWYPPIMPCSFIEAIEIVEQMNAEQEGGYKKWRIPTITELLSIATGTGNHFPAELDVIEGRSFTLWTSTPVRKEGTVLNHDKENKAYYLLQINYNHNTSRYSLSFGFQNVEEKGNEKAFLLPVFSRQIYTYEPTQTQGSPPTGPFLPKKNMPPVDISIAKQQEDKVPGFDDRADPSKTHPSPKTPGPGKQSGPVKIPGFDDVSGERSQKKQEKKNTSAANPDKAPRKIKIAFFPYHRKGVSDKNKKQILNDLNDELGKTLKDLGSELKRTLNLSLKIDKASTKTPGSIELFTDKTFSQDLKRYKIKTEVMTPYKIDIIVIVELQGGGDFPVQVMEMTIISRTDDKIHTKRIIHSKSDYTILKEFVKDTVKQIVYGRFSN